jgi:hypothetical protein
LDRRKRVATTVKHFHIESLFTSPLPHIIHHESSQPCSAERAITKCCCPSLVVLIVHLYKHRPPLLRFSARTCMKPGNATQSLAVILSSWLPRRTIGPLSDCHLLMRSLHHDHLCKVRLLLASLSFCTSERSLIISRVSCTVRAIQW